jgi:predicted TIM-barrel enzyme
LPSPSAPGPGGGGSLFAPETGPYVFDTDQAADMAKAGADVLVPHMGLTSSGTIGAQTTITLQDTALRVQGMHDAAKKVNPDSGAVDTCFSAATYIT